MTVALPPPRLPETPSQTAGPYVHIGCTPNHAEIFGVWDADLGVDLVGAEAAGERVTVTGRVLDGTGTPLRDAMVEIWQADAAGLYPSPAEARGQADPHFRGWARQPTGMSDGTFTFHTLKPGRVPWRLGRDAPLQAQHMPLQAPHISFFVVARGINVGLNTRMYFGDEGAANDEDPLLARLEHRGRVATLVSQVEAADDHGPVHRFDIHLQGERETVFLAI